jgi:vitellogenic carboxypeptidase-like protein
MRPIFGLLLLSAIMASLSSVDGLIGEQWDRKGMIIDDSLLLGPSDPLILSKYLNDPETGRKLSEVNGVGSYRSYAGYFTVNETFGSNMFFWYFPAQNGNPQAPLVMFLQGGPGASSMFGLFREMGPYQVASDGKTLIPNPFTWNKQYSLMFVDNPVGAGWSFTQDVRGFVKNEDDVAENLHSLLLQFFDIFPDQRSVDFYVAGESYAGHYVPAIGNAIVERNKKESKKINLVGIAIGDGSIEPLIQFANMGDLWFRMGLASEDEKREIERKYSVPFVDAVKRREYVKAFDIFDQLMNGDFWSYGTYFQNITGLGNYFNVLQPKYPPNPYQSFLNLATTRAAIHVGASAYWDYNSTVEYHLIPDWMTSVSHRLANIANHHVKCLIYTGQLDLILGSAANEDFLQQFKWDGSHQWLSSHKRIWHLNNDPSTPPLGYARSFQNFHQVVVRNAGHLLPLDQPAAALDMISRFIGNIPF